MSDRATLAVGIDIGTSGARTAVVDASGDLVADARAPLAREPVTDGPMAGDPRAVDAESWWRAVDAALAGALDGLGPDRAAVRALAVDGTSGSVVLVDGNARPLTPGLLYDAKGFDAEGEAIDAVAPPRSVARGGGSALARVLHLHALAPGAFRLCHQADLAVARLLGHAGLSDESNALKTGYDPAARVWPDWIAATGLPLALLPEARPVGSVLGSVGTDARTRFGLPADAVVVAGASDSTAAFLGATGGSAAPGTAVTSLGTTVAVKIASDAPVEDAGRGIYSHRVGDRWLPGGASNTGGGALLRHYGADEIAALSERIDPAWEPSFDAYPLPAPGERFPINDPAYPPREGDDRPGERGSDADIRYLHALLHGIARIERDGYRALAELGAPYPSRVLTSGGGARNGAWTAIRTRLLGVPVVAATADPALGMARLALRAVAGRAAA